MKLRVEMAPTSFAGQGQADSPSGLRPPDADLHVDTGRSEPVSGYQSPTTLSRETTVRLRNTLVCTVNTGGRVATIGVSESHAG